MTKWMNEKTIEELSETRQGLDVNGTFLFIIGIFIFGLSFVFNACFHLFELLIVMIGSSVVILIIWCRFSIKSDIYSVLIALKTKNDEKTLATSDMERFMHRASHKNLKQLLDMEKEEKNDIY